MRVSNWVLVCVLSTSAWAQVPPTFTAAEGVEDRVARLVRTVDSMRPSRLVPGMALVVVRDDRVLVMRGFGLADREEARPVTPDTLFAIGSCTKAFTSTLTAMLVDGGWIGWDDAIADPLPGFRLQVASPDPGARPTIRDLLSHRTGHTRMGVLWASGNVGRDDILKTAARAEPWAPFRERFQYNNVMYLAVGEASANVAGASWNRMLRQRLLRPVGMKDTNASVGKSRADRALASGYEWDDGLSRFRRVPYRPLKNIAPAAGVNSNARDMARWLRFLLAGGAIDGTRLVRETTLEQTWLPHIGVADGIDYGMGWFLGEWDGRRVAYHGGNIDGFAAQVAIMPDEGIGLALLTNVSATPLQTEIMPLVWEALLGPPATPETPGPTREADRSSAVSSNAIEAPPFVEMPSTEALLQLRQADRRADILASLGEVRMTGVARMPQAGLEGAVTREFLGTDRLRQEVDFGRFGHATLTVRGNQARTESSYGPTERLRGTRLAQARQSHPALSFGDWRARFDSIRAVGADTIDGRRVWIVELREGGLPPVREYVDVETGDTLVVEMSTVLPGGRGTLPNRTVLRDHRNVEGLRIPFEVVTSDDANGRVLLRFDDIDTGLHNRPGTFDVPD